MRESLPGRRNLTPPSAAPCVAPARAFSISSSQTTQRPTDSITAKLSASCLRSRQRISISARQGPSARAGYSKAVAIAFAVKLLPHSGNPEQSRPLWVLAGIGAGCWRVGCGASHEPAHSNAFPGLPTAERPAWNRVVPFDARVLSRRITLLFLGGHGLPGPRGATEQCCAHSTTPLPSPDNPTAASIA